MYGEGASINEIARVVRRSHTTVRRSLVDAGVTIRPSPVYPNTPIERPNR